MSYILDERATPVLRGDAREQLLAEARAARWYDGLSMAQRMDKLEREQAERTSGVGAGHRELAGQPPRERACSHTAVTASPSPRSTPTRSGRRAGDDRKRANDPTCVESVHALEGAWTLDSRGSCTGASACGIRASSQ
jgi:hypothetical protein